MKSSINRLSEVAKIGSSMETEDNREDQMTMSKTGPPVPAWRLIPGRIPLDVQICACVACLTAFALILQVVFAYNLPEPSSRRGAIWTAWITAFWTYLGCCIHFADMALDRQARYELEQQEQPILTNDEDDETSSHAEQIKSTGPRDELKTPSTTVQPCYTGSHNCEVQTRPRRGWRTREFKATILFNMNPQRYSLTQLVRRATITCTLMIEGLVLVPFVLYLGQKLFLSEDDVDEGESNIPSWSLLFWAFALLGTSKYGSIIQETKKKEEQVVHKKMKQIPSERIAEQHDEEVGQFD